MPPYGSMQVRQLEATYRAVVYIAGDYNFALEALREWCDKKGDCWSAERVDYVYSGGQEAGVKVTRIFYPRFPDCTADDMQALGEEMGLFLMDRLHQASCTAIGPHRTTFMSRFLSNK